MRTLIFGIAFIIVIGGAYLLYTGYGSMPESNLEVIAQTYCGNENVASVEISDSSNSFRVNHVLLGGGSTFYSAEGGEDVQCPVVGPDYMSAECKEYLDVNDWKAICTNELLNEQPSDEEAELTGYTFILDFIQVAPPEPNQQAVDRVMESLSQSAQTKVSRNTVMPDLARFVGVQDVPDQGASVEDLQAVSSTERILVVGLNYSGGRTLRNVHLVVEGGEWKVDRVSIPQQTEQFEAVGNITNEAVGMKEGAWYLVYEEPGKPALTKTLVFESSSICAEGVENNTCDTDTFESGMRVKILGDYIDADTVRVIRMEIQ